MIERLSSALIRRGPLILALGIVLGLIVPVLASSIRPGLGPLVALLMLIAALRIDAGQLIGVLRRPLVPMLALALQLVGTPLLVWVVVLALGLPSHLAWALVLNGAAPTLMSSVVLARLIGLDDALALSMITGSTLLLPLTLPAVLYLLLGLDSGLELGAFALRFLAYIVFPFGLAWALRRLLDTQVFTTHAAGLDALNVVVVTLAGIALMDGVSDRLRIDPGMVALYLAAATGLNIAFHLLGAALFWRLGPHRAFSLALSLGNRNMAMVLVLTGASLGPDFALYVAMAQIPMYLLPVIVRPFTGRYV